MAYGLNKIMNTLVNQSKLFKKGMVEENTFKECTI